VNTQPTKKNPVIFDDFAERYDRNDEITGGWITQWVEGVLADKSGESAIDLGCGSGRVAHVLAKHYEKVRAIDLSPEMVELAQRKRPHPRIVFEAADLTTVTGQYDLVISMMTLHHLPDVDATLRHIASLVKPGGTAILVDNAMPNSTTRMGQRIWAAQVLAQDILHAFQKFRFALNKRWLDHVMSDRYLTPERFVAEYGKAFPGAAIAPVGHLYTSVWERSPEAAQETAQ
jgi:2-polyprenyl-3-methyl-5-hydroxy-6-metoxy-1,4-benzoquinol methylase